jgi:hypothetical protein
LRRLSELHRFIKSDMLFKCFGNVNFYLVMIVAFC